MKKVKKILPIFIAAALLTALAAVMMPSPSAAANSYTLHLSQSTVSPGDTIAVTVRLNGASQYINGIAAIQADFSYNSEYLTYEGSTIAAPLEYLKSTSACGIEPSANGGRASVMAYAGNMDVAMPSSIDNIVTFRFKVNENTPVGQPLEFAFITGEDSASALSYYTGEDELTTENAEFSFGSPVTASVVEKKSSDATLSDLSVQGNSFTRSFLPTRYDYTLAAELEHNVTSINVNYTKSDEKSTVIMTGNTDIPVGNSKVRIKVTAEDGTVITYTISVTRKSLPVSVPSSAVSSEPGPSSDVSSGSSSSEVNSSSSGVSSDTGSGISSDVSGGSSGTGSFDSYEDLQQTINQLKIEKQKILDRQFVIIIVFTALTVALLSALIVIAVNYKRDVK